MADIAAVFGKAPTARQRVPGKDPFQVTQVGLLNPCVPKQDVSNMWTSHDGVSSFASTIQQSQGSTGYITC